MKKGEGLFANLFEFFHSHLRNKRCRRCRKIFWILEHLELMKPTIFIYPFIIKNKIITNNKIKYAQEYVLKLVYYDVSTVQAAIIK